MIVSAQKYDGTEHRRWSARVVRREGPLLVLDALFDQEIEHEWLGTISAGTVSTEYYWLDKWYNIFRFSEPAGKQRRYNFKLNAPPAFHSRTLKYTELEVDVIVNANPSY